ncbi:class II aldolase/adducin family protein [Endozoicomonas atrinae]|uniref:class II aldolase/adducin family protein n=1 Tax=Endozoicomonas atrinae TaxID=1333660 RepID=UPI003AFFFBBD
MGLPDAEKNNRFDESEWKLRLDLAACYRLIAYFGWDDLIYTHITCRLTDGPSDFLINPFGMMFDEITASSLVRIDLDGNKVEHSDWPVNPAGFVIHSAIHQVREDVRCVLHAHTVATVAVSALECGLLPLSQHAMLLFQRVAYHDYEGISVNKGERQCLQKDMGQNNVMFLRNHGVLVAGATIAEAFQNFYFLQKACEIQVQAMGCGTPIVQIQPEVEQVVINQYQEANLGRGAELSWPGLLRRLDRIDPSWRE